jgi:hypothetical protein
VIPADDAEKAALRESEIHAELATSRIKREWFALEPVQVFLQNLKGSAGKQSPETLSGSSVLPTSTSDLPTDRVIAHAPPEGVWRQRSNDRPIDTGMDYHRRNCPTWGLAACEWGRCIPKYLWPQWEKRQGPVVAVAWLDSLRFFVEGEIARGDWQPGDTPEKWWPARFEQHFGTSVQPAATTHTREGRIVGSAQRTVAAIRRGEL